MTSEHSTTARWIRLGVDFEEGGNRSARGKPSKSGWDRLKLSPHTTFVVEVEGVIDVHYASLTSQAVQHGVFYFDGHPSRYQPRPTSVNRREPVFPFGDNRTSRITAKFVRITKMTGLCAFPLTVTLNILSKSRYNVDLIWFWDLRSIWCKFIDVCRIRTRVPVHGSVHKSLFFCLRGKRLMRNWGSPKKVEVKRGVFEKNKYS